MDVILNLWSEVIGEPELGLWCPACALPSAVRARVAVGNGLSVIFNQVLTVCHDCGRKVSTAE